MLNAPRFSPTGKKRRLPRQPTKAHGRATTKGYSQYSIAHGQKKGAYLMKYNFSYIMRKAWTLFRKLGVSFGECLRRAWAAVKAEPVNAERIARAKAAAGVTEATNTWSGWQKAGYEVIHGSKALFGADLIYAVKGNGAVYKARFFGVSQVKPIGE